MGDGRACPLERVILHPSGRYQGYGGESSFPFVARPGSGGEEGTPLPVGAHKIFLRLRIKEVEEIESSLEDSI